MEKECFHCQGQGKIHRTAIRHIPGCQFCSKCVCCNGSGRVPKLAQLCHKCKGEGRYHESIQPHTVDCIFCTKCKDCQQKGHVYGKQK